MFDYNIMFLLKMVYKTPMIYCNSRLYKEFQVFGDNCTASITRIDWFLPALESRFPKGIPKGKSLRSHELESVISSGFMLHKLSKGIGTRKDIESSSKYSQIYLIILTYFCWLYKILIRDMSQLILSSSAVSVELMKIHGVHGCTPLQMCVSCNSRPGKSHDQSC